MCFNYVHALLVSIHGRSENNGRSKDWMHVEIENRMF